MDRRPGGIYGYTSVEFGSSSPAGGDGMEVQMGGTCMRYVSWLENGGWMLRYLYPWSLHHEAVPMKLPNRAELRSTKNEVVDHPH